MAWFRKERKPRQPRRERLEIPADAWEKCEACGHTDLREKFVRNLNVCPNCDYHRRIRASDYVSILVDDNSYEELDVDLKSVDPLGFPEYPQRLKKALATAGDYDAVMSVSGTLGGIPINLGAMDFAFMGGSMGSVVGEKIARLGQRSLERKFPLVLVSASGGARMQEGVLSLMQMAKTAALLAQLGFPAFHVAGTNGKGSVVSTLDALLRAQGLRVGRYTSPHLIDFRERICVNAEPIEPEAVVTFIERWTPEVERLGATFFEATTCLAFDHFARSGVDVAVVEVGLGGRLDATNVITPVSTGIASIGLDHMQYLGDTTELIAREKAGIFKRDVPAVIGEAERCVRRLLRELAEGAGARPVCVIADDSPIEDIA